jgi:putative transcriptional regulator
MTKRIYRSDLIAAVHEDARALYDVGAISKKTMREFDESCLAPIEEFTPEAIQEIREKERVSQPVFAHYMNVTKGMVSAWERGTKKPSGPALRLLSVVKKKGIDSIV